MIDLPILFSYSNAQAERGAFEQAGAHKGNLLAGKHHTSLGKYRWLLPGSYWKKNFSGHTIDMKVEMTTIIPSLPHQIWWVVFLESFHLNLILFSSYVLNRFEVRICFALFHYFPAKERLLHSPEISFPSKVFLAGLPHFHCAPF